MRDGLMLRTVELEGSPQELGRRHGQALGPEIRRMRRGLLAYLARLSLYAGALPLFGGLLILARRFLPYVPAHLKQEMAAVAAGAQVSLGTVLLINVADDLANNTPRCSALAVGEARSLDGASPHGAQPGLPGLPRRAGAAPRPSSSWNRARAGPWPPWPGRDMWGCAPA